MSEAEQIAAKILDFMKKAGKLAVENQNKINFFASKIKHGGVISVVTETDLSVSKLFREFVTQEFACLNPLIVDEETVAELGDNPLDKIRAAEYAFIIDPIDGTLPYSAKLPLYGISVGVFKNGSPYCGALYAPALRELVYADDKKAYAVENAFFPDEKIQELKALPDDIDSEPLFFASPTKVRLNSRWDKKEIVPVDMYSAVLNCIGMAKGQARGYFFQAYLWDIAGALPAFEKVGVKLLEINSGGEFSPLGEGVFNNYLKCPKVYIACRPKYFEYLRNIVER